MLSSLTAVIAQSSRTITGTVYDATDKKPLPGVAVRVDGANVSTQTNNMGAFIIKVPVGQQYLVISFLGYEKQKVILKKESF